MKDSLCGHLSCSSDGERETYNHVYVRKLRQDIMKNNTKLENAFSGARVISPSCIV